VKIVRKALRILSAPFTLKGRRFLEHRTANSWMGFYLILTRVYRATFARHQRMIVVIGSLGKTTTTRAILQAFHLPEGRVHENLNFGGKMALTFMGFPLRQRTVVLEVGIAGPGQMRYMTAVLRPDAIVFTCVATEHIFSFRDKAHIAEEKATAIQDLRPGGLVVINGDDPLIRAAVARYPVAVTTFGFDQGNDCHGVSWNLDWPKGSRLRLAMAGREHELETELLSRDSGYALLAAWAIAHECGQADALTHRGLMGLAAVPGRMQKLATPSGAWILRDDFKSTYETIHLALDVLMILPGRRIVVIGGIEAAPNPQKIAYEAIARRIGEVADEVVVVHGDWNNLYKAELNRQVAGQARLNKVTVVRSSADAIAVLRGTLGPGDIILIKGRVREYLGDVAHGLAC
jgi:UDP-N-acetylmuramoyl-tripeptide--D-alanyl-D-alanine ligase